MNSSYTRAGQFRWPRILIGRAASTRRRSRSAKRTSSGFRGSTWLTILLRLTGRRPAPVRFEVLAVPGDVALEPVLEIGRLADPVVLARVDDQLGVDTLAAQRLVHLLGVQQRDVEVLVAAQEQ